MGRQLLDGFPIHLIAGSSDGAPVLLLSDAPVEIDLGPVGDDRPVLRTTERQPPPPGKFGMIVRGPARRPLSPEAADGWLSRLEEGGTLVELIDRPDRSIERFADDVMVIHPRSGSTYFVTRQWLARPWPFNGLQLGRPAIWRLRLSRLARSCGLRPLADVVAVVVRNSGDRDDPPTRARPGAAETPAGRSEGIFVRSRRMALVLPAARPEVVVKLPLGEDVSRSMRRGAQAQAALHDRQDEVLDRVVPRSLDSAPDRRQPYWIESRVTGAAGTRRSWIPGRRRAVASAGFGFLLRLHESTARPTLIDDRLLDRLLDEPVATVTDAARAVDPGFDPAPVVARVRETLCGKTIPLVRTHGDFWPGNIHVTDSGELTAVIDWAGSREQGWPLVDLLHLLAFRWKPVAIHFFSRVVRHVFFPRRLGGWREEMLRQYERRLGLDRSLWPAFVALYWLEHAAQYVDGPPAGGGIHAGWLKRNVIRPAHAIARALP